MEHNDDVKEILYQQLQLLAEASQKYGISVRELCDLTSEMYRIANAIYTLDARSE